MTEDPLSDPRFPDRPQHPDFWALVSAANYLDGEALEGGHSAPDILARYCDVNSLQYMAAQRVMRGQQVSGIRLSPQEWAMVMALYVDGFAMGCRYSEEKK
jgi:hypothetical protein